MAYTSGISRERSRRRRRSMRRLSVWLLVAAGLGALGYSAYQTGTVLAESRVTELERKVGDLTTQLAGARGESARFQTSLGSAEQSILALQRRYNSEVPTGDLADLFVIVRERLSQGVPTQRLAQVLRDAGPTRPCDTGATHKRFAIQLAGRETEEPALLLDGLVQVSATTSGINAEALRSAAVTVALAWAKEPLKLTGLPVRQDIAINNAMLRLTVDASEVPRYAVATLSTCGKAIPKG
jgi:hypothetical protein